MIIIVILVGMFLFDPVQVYLSGHVRRIQYVQPIRYISLLSHCSTTWFIKFL